MTMSPAYQIRCKELLALVTEYLEDALAPAEQIRFEQHLSWCEGCDRFLAEMRRTLQVAGRLSQATVAPPARDALMEAFRDWARDDQP